MARMDMDWNLKKLGPLFKVLKVTLSPFLYSYNYLQNKYYGHCFLQGILSTGKESNDTDHNTFVGNCPPTPPLSQH